MELELGLALPVHVPIENLDLNINSLEPKEGNLFGCGLDLIKTLEFKNHKEKKRTFAEAFDDECISKTPSLLVWNGQPNGGDDRKGGKRRSFDPIGNANEEEDNQIVGWPPIKSWREKLLHPQQIRQGCGGIKNGRGAKRGSCNNGGRNSIYVKVKMEGVAIGRKIDLMLFNSYQALIHSLLNMFARYRENDKDDEPYNYVLSYLDKEGDWLMAGNVPWQIFIETVQRMEISKQIIS